MAISRKRGASFKGCGKFLAYARVTGLIALGTYAALVCWESHRRSTDIHLDFFPSALDKFASANAQREHSEGVNLRGDQGDPSLAMSQRQLTEELLEEDPSDDAFKSLRGAIDEELAPSENGAVMVQLAAKVPKTKVPDLLTTDGEPSKSKACKIVKIVSSGKANSNGEVAAEFYLGEQLIDSPSSQRGLNVVTIDMLTQEVIAKKNYDTYEDPGLAKENLAVDIDELKPGSMVLMGLMDSGMENLDASLFTLFQTELGAKISAGTFREGYALIAVKGGGAALAEEQGPTVTVSGELPCHAIPTQKPTPLLTVASSKSSETSSGGTDCQRFKVKILSAGKDAGNAANFYINGKMVRSNKPSSRGLNVVAVDPRNGKLIWKRCYDVWEAVEAANEKLFDDLEKLSHGTVVLVAAMDSGMENLDTYALDALQSCGASITKGAFRTGYALIGVKGAKKVAEKMAPSAEISGSPQCPSADYSIKKDKTHSGAEQKSDRSLFVVVSDSMFYKTRVKWILDTWGKDVPEGDLLVVADKKTKDEPAVQIGETPCPRGSHDVGCCKYGHAVFLASLRLKEDASFEWFYFADDDVYVRPDALKRRLSKRRVTKWPVAKGLLGCANEAPGCSGICGGGGFLLNAKGLLKLVGDHTRESFVKLFMKSCTHCSHWGDLAVSKMIKDSNVKLETMLGLHPWKLAKPAFIDQLRSAHPPVTLHYQRNEQQLHFLHKMFSPSQKERPVDGKKSSKTTGDKLYACLTYEGRKVCAKSGGETDVPWR